MEWMVNPQEYDYLSRNKLITQLCEKYPFIKDNIIGISCQGKNIRALKIGNADAYCLMAAAFHGSERITSVVALMFLERLCRAIEQNGYIAGLKARRALTGRGVIIVPCVNPDGCDISLLGAKACGKDAIRIGRLCNNDFAHWNANFRGVDINHNFDAGWEQLRILEEKKGIYGPSKTRFGGYRPESEPETVALTQLCRSIQIRHVLALHSQGEVIYWNYGNKTIPRSRKMAEIMATSSGYALDIPIGLASGGGFKDWFICEFLRPGFTVELGLGENPLPCESAEAIYEKVEEMLMLCTIM
ncbi:MAG: M14 family metallocarboxypeptidase [Clostridia bacterium]|nr:M14 family metallocarboxypeptidase [Clostridia bacterium]